MNPGINGRPLLLRTDPNRNDLSQVANALRLTTDLVRVHGWLVNSGVNPSADLLPRENTLEAASRLLSWLASALAGYPNGEMPPLPNDVATEALRKYLEKARWS